MVPNPSRSARVPFAALLVASSLLLPTAAPAQPTLPPLPVSIPSGPGGSITDPKPEEIILDPIGFAGNPFGLTQFVLDTAPVLGPIYGQIYQVAEPVLQQLNQVIPPGVLDPLADVAAQTRPLFEAYDIYGNKLFSQRGALGVPMPIDFSAGDPGPELVAQAIAVPGTPGTPLTVQITMTPIGAATEAARSVVLMVTLWSNHRDSYVVGYRTDGVPLPDAFEVTATLVPGAVDIDVTSNTNRNPLTLIGQARGAYGRDMAATAGLTPMPAIVGLRLTGTPAEPCATVSVSEEAALGVSGQIIESPYVKQFGLTMYNVPAAGTIEGEPGSVRGCFATGNETAKIRYNAAGDVGFINAGFQSFGGGPLVDHVSVVASGLPQSVTVDRDSASHVTVSSSAPIGAIDFAMGHLREAKHRYSDLGPRHFWSETYSDGGLQLAARVEGLNGAELSWGDEVRIDFTHSPGVVKVIVKDLAIYFATTVRDLPADVYLAFNKTTKHLTYTGSSTITELSLYVDANGGTLFGRVKEIWGTIKGLPSGVDLAVAETRAGEDRRIQLASNEPIGLIDMELTSGPHDPVPGDGAALRVQDLADRYYVHARISNIQSVDVNTTSACTGGPIGNWMCTKITTVDLVGTGGQVVWSDFKQLKKRADGTQDPSSVDYIIVNAGPLPPHLNLVMQSRNIYAYDGGIGWVNYVFPLETSLNYHGYDAAGNLYTPPNSFVAIHTEVGPPGSVLGGSITPLAGELGFCRATDGRCAIGGEADGGSIQLHASQEVVVNLLSCEEWANCNHDSVTVSDLHVKHVSFQNQPVNDDHYWGYAWLDTAGNNLSGNIRVLAEDGGESMNAILPAGFYTYNRMVNYTNFPWQWRTTGRIHCPGGTHFWTGNPGIDVAWIVCMAGE